MVDVTDGLSNTAAFSERRVGDFSNALITPQTDLLTGSPSPNTPDEAYAICNALDYSTVASQWRSDYGGHWLQGWHMTLYTHAGPPNTRSCGFPPTKMIMVPNSNHPQGLNLLLCDGSVRFVKSTVNLATWRALGTKDGREVIPSDF